MVCIDFETAQTTAKPKHTAFSNGILSSSRYWSTQSKSQKNQTTLHIQLGLEHSLNCQTEIKDVSDNPCTCCCRRKMCVCLNSVHVCITVGQGEGHNCPQAGGDIL